MLTKDFGKCDLGPFEADIACRKGIWMFKPYYTSHPKDAVALQLNALILELGRLWTPVPESQVAWLEQYLKEQGKLP